MSIGESAKSIRDALKECPICTDSFHDPSRIPRRMPCCDRLICQPCLEIYNPECQNVCPLCHRQQNISNRIMYLPIAVLIFRFLDVLKSHGRGPPNCGVCPNKRSAVSNCVNCNAYFCQPCVASHIQNTLSSDHRIIYFANTQSLEPAVISPAVTVSERKPQGKLEKKLDSIKQRYETLSEIEANVEKSRRMAIEQINTSFDELINVLQQRRATLLSQVEIKADRELQSITKGRESQDTLQHASDGQQSPVSLDVLQTGSTIYRFGISFIPANTQQLKDTVKAAGHVRTVDFKPATKSDSIPKTEIYNAIQIQPHDFPQVGDMDVTIPREIMEILCPHLEFDLNVASCDVTVYNTVVTNTKSNPAPPDTGCRIQEGKLAIMSRPLVISRGQSRPQMYHVKVKYSLKQEIEENMAIYELAQTSFPVDSGYAHNNGLSIQVSVCSNHKQHLCLHVVYNRNLLTDIPISRNQAGVSHDLKLCFLLDGETSMIHVIDVNDTSVIQSVTNVRFDKPLWITVGVETRGWSDTESELLSGNNINLSQELTELLNILHMHLF